MRRIIIESSGSGCSEPLGMIPTSSSPRPLHGAPSHAPFPVQPVLTGSRRCGHRNVESYVAHNPSFWRCHFNLRGSTRLTPLSHPTSVVPQAHIPRQLSLHAAPARPHPTVISPGKPMKHPASRSPAIRIPQKRSLPFSVFARDRSHLSRPPNIRRARTASARSRRISI